MKSRNLMVIALAVMTLISVSACQPQEDLHLLLSMEHRTYHQGEHIAVQVILQNRGSDNLRIQTRMAINYPPEIPAFGDVYFVITSPSGKVVAFDQLTRVRTVDLEDFKILDAGKTYPSEHPLEYQITSFYAPFDEVGTYSVQAIYENRRDPGDGRSAWKGRLTSNTVTFALEP